MKKIILFLVMILVLLSSSKANIYEDYINLTGDLEVSGTISQPTTLECTLCIDDSDLATDFEESDVIDCATTDALLIGSSQTPDDYECANVTNNETSIDIGDSDNPMEFVVYDDGLASGEQFRWVEQKGSMISGMAWSTTNIGYYSFAGGFESRATGDYSFAMGYQTQATSEGAIAFGNGAIASGVHSVAMGTSANATGVNNIALGYDSSTYSKSSNNNAIAIGYKAEAIADNAIAIGYQAFAGGTNSIALSGRAAQAYSTNSIAMGYYTNVTGDYSFGVSGYTGSYEEIPNNSIFAIRNMNFTVNDGTDDILFVDQINNRVGIMDNTPTSAFTVSGIGMRILRSDWSNITAVRLTTNTARGHMGLNSGGTQYTFFRGTNTNYFNTNLGIETPNPEGELDINGSLVIETGTDADDSAIRFLNSTGSQNAAIWHNSTNGFIIQGSSTNYTIQFGPQSGTPFFKFQDSGVLEIIGTAIAPPTYAEGSGDMLIKADLEVDGDIFVKDKVIVEDRPTAYLTSSTYAGDHYCALDPSTCCDSTYHMCQPFELKNGGRRIEDSGTDRDTTPYNTNGDVNILGNATGYDCEYYNDTTDVNRFQCSFTADYWSCGYVADCSTSEQVWCCSND